MITLNDYNLESNESDTRVRKRIPSDAGDFLLKKLWF